MVREVTQTVLMDLFEYNPETGEFIRKVRKKNPIAGTLDSYGYRQISVHSKLHLAHRLAWMYVYGRWPNGEIDHINGIRSDNRIENLRESSRLDNVRSRKNLSVKNTSGFMGVGWSDAANKWVARIGFNGKGIHIGVFEDPEEAHKAYLAKKEELYAR